MCGVESNYPVGDISKALRVSMDIYTTIDYQDDFEDEVRKELETTIIGLIKSLRIAAFHSSEKR